MKTAKQEVLDLVAQLPDDISYETILAEMQFKLDVLRGYEQFLKGHVSEHDDVIGRIRTWRTSSGQNSPSAISRKSATS